MKRPLALIILDGWGYRNELEYNAIAQARPSFFMHLLEHYPHTFLKASGVAVGLLEGMPGNSRVGHFTLGIGKVIEQPIAFLTHAYQKKILIDDVFLRDGCALLRKNNKRLHIIGLLSDGAVHGMDDHFYPWILYALLQGLEVIVHVILDGRDVAPQSAAIYLEKLDIFLQDKPNVCIGSLHGRFYAMDRDFVWSRTLLSYQTLTQKQTHESIYWKDALKKSYDIGIFDEFFIPLQLCSHAYIQEDDAVTLLLVRSDRARQLVSLLLHTPLHREQENHNQLVNEVVVQNGPHISWCCTAVSYYPLFKTHVLYDATYTGITLLDALADRHKTIFTIAETEKYAHVTYFFNGGKEAIRSSEQRVLVQSKDVPSYADAPEMSAQEITDAVLFSLRSAPCDFYLINYANADMVGHSGDFNATMRAVQFLDTQLKKIVTEVVEVQKGAVFITADHGKAEEMFDKENQQVKTAHTTALVPFLSVHKDVFMHKMPQSLADVMAYVLAYSDFIDAHFQE